MKTNEEMSPNEVSNSEKTKKNRRWMIHVIYCMIIIIIILLCRCCSGKKEKEYEAVKISLLSEIDSLNLRINQLENRKAVLNVTENVNMNNSHGTFVKAIIVSLEDKRDSSLFIKDIVKIVNVPVPFLVKCPPIIPSKKCPDIDKDLVYFVADMNNSLNDSIDVCLDKQYRTDSSRILMQKKLSLRDFTSMNPPSLAYNHIYIEYLPNKYRAKAEDSFWNGILFTAISAGSYVFSESLGHPKYWDNQDNSKAERKSSLILGSRLISGASAFMATVEFGRAFYFHNMESKFIVSPTKIGLTLNLSPNNKEK